MISRIFHKSWKLKWRQLHVIYFHIFLRMKKTIKKCFFVRVKNAFILDSLSFEHDLHFYLSIYQAGSSLQGDSYHTLIWTLFTFLALALKSASTVTLRVMQFYILCFTTSIVCRRRARRRTDTKQCEKRI